MQLAFEVWPPLLFYLYEDPGNLSVRTTHRRKNTCYQVYIHEALMSCLVVLILQPEALEEVANIFVKTGLTRGKLIVLKITRAERDLVCVMLDVLQVYLKMSYFRRS